MITLDLVQQKLGVMDETLVTQYIINMFEGVETATRAIPSFSMALIASFRLPHLPPRTMSMTALLIWIARLSSA